LGAVVAIGAVGAVVAMGAIGSWQSIKKI